MNITRFVGETHRSHGYDFSIGKLWGSFSFNPVYKTFQGRKPYEMRGYILMGFGVRLAIYWGV